LYWPPNVPVAETEEAFIAAFETKGFKRCGDGRLETEFEKIVIYFKGIQPTHASRQLKSGRWTSKLGPQEDIEHNAVGLLLGPDYGDRVIYMKRARG